MLGFDVSRFQKTPRDSQGLGKGAIVHFEPPKGMEISCTILIRPKVAFSGVTSWKLWERAATAILCDTATPKDPGFDRTCAHYAI